MEKVDWEYVRQEVYDKGTTRSSRSSGRWPPISPTSSSGGRFGKSSTLKPPPEEVTVRLAPKPAEKTQIDFCDGVFLTDPATGHKTLTQFFLGVLPLSSWRHRRRHRPGRRFALNDLRELETGGVRRFKKPRTLGIERGKNLDLAVVCVWRETGNGLRAKMSCFPPERQLRKH